MDAGITADMILRRAQSPYTWTWMWGFYDDLVGCTYADYFTKGKIIDEKKEQDKDSICKKSSYFANLKMRDRQYIKMYLDLNVAEKNHHKETTSVLVEPTSNIFKKYLASKILINKKFKGSYFGYGMHKKRFDHRW